MKRKGKTVARQSDKHEGNTTQTVQNIQAKDKDLSKREE